MGDPQETCSAPEFVLSADDPSAPFAVLAYASSAHRRGADPALVQHAKDVAAKMYEWQDSHGIVAPGLAATTNSKIEVMFRTADGEEA